MPIHRAGFFLISQKIDFSFSGGRKRRDKKSREIYPAFKKCKETTFNMMKSPSIEKVYFLIMI